MPVTQTARRALRSSRQKENINKAIASNLEIAIRKAKKTPNKKTVTKAISLADRAAKKKFIHQNRAARVKSQLSRLLTH